MRSFWCLTTTQTRNTRFEHIFEHEHQEHERHMEDSEVVQWFVL